MAKSPPQHPQKILVIQTAFIGDVILATALLEDLHQQFPDASIDFMLRKGNESLLDKHPFLNHVHVWDKKQGKWSSLWKLVQSIRKERYDLLVNLQRFASSGLATAFSRAKFTIGFEKNPLSTLFDRKKPHTIGDGSHETERNHSLIADLIDGKPSRPTLYPSATQAENVRQYQAQPYLCLAPTSVWFTKQFAAEKWVELIKNLPPQQRIYLLGAPTDQTSCEAIRKQSEHGEVVNLAGKLSLLESAALMKGAQMNYVNDSAPLHLATSVNAPVVAIFCSTVPRFGFYPLSDISHIAETTEELDCRPCGLHGFKACPKGHFKCSSSIAIKPLAALAESTS